MSKYVVFSGPYFPAFALNTERYCVSLSIFSPNAGKYGTEKTPYLDTFHTVLGLINPFHTTGLFLYFIKISENQKLKTSENFQKQSPGGALKNFSKFKGKHLCQSLLILLTLLKKRLWHRCFPVNFDKFLRTPFL